MFAQNVIKYRGFANILPHRYFSAAVRSLNDNLAILSKMGESKLRDFNVAKEVADELAKQIASEPLSEVMKAAGCLTQLNINHEAFHLSVAAKVVSSGAHLNKADLLSLLDIFSKQRLRQIDLIKMFEISITACESEMNVSELARMLYASTNLSILPAEKYVEYASRICSDDSATATDLGLAAESLCLSEQDGQCLPLLKDLLSKATDRGLLNINMASIKSSLAKQSNEEGVNKRFIFEKMCYSWSIVRYVLKHCHSSEYQLLSDQQRLALKKCSRAESEIYQLKVKESGSDAPVTQFNSKLAAILDELRIAYHQNVRRGPFKLDLVERDQQLVWICADASKFFASTFDMTPRARLQNRVVKAMGYKVSSTAWWQWSRMRVKRTRIDFIRMSRYYALRDRRLFEGAEDGFEGWRLPHLQKKSPRAVNVHVPGYFTGFESHAESPY